MSEWNTDKAPTEADGHEDADHCVEVTYTNGLLGWEPIRDFKKWPADDSAVVAWRPIRPAYKE